MRGIETYLSVWPRNPLRGYTATKDQLLTRLRRIEGQVRGVQGMVAEARYRIDVFTLGISMSQMGMSMNMTSLNSAQPFDRAFIDMMIPTIRVRCGWLRRS